MNDQILKTTITKEITQTLSTLCSIIDAKNRKIEELTNENTELNNRINQLQSSDNLQLVVKDMQTELQVAREHIAKNPP